MVTQKRTAAEAGWHVSRYNLYLPLKEEKKMAIVNLYKANCAVYSSLEYYLLTVLDELDENHPVIGRFAKRGIIANFDELAALQAGTRLSHSEGVSLTICPTMDCNFDCPYCFENHVRGFMSEEVQDGVVALAEKMIAMAKGKYFYVTWFGGEPLLAPEIIRSLSRRLISLARENHLDYKASIITNGYLLNEKNTLMLKEARVSSIQVTLDGMEEVHNQTRRLRNGGGTFNQITENLTKLDGFFSVSVRHNVHQDNIKEIDKLSAFVNELDGLSQAKLSYHAAVVSDNEASKGRGSNVGLLCIEDQGKVVLQRDAQRFAGGGGQFCGAHNMFNIGIDAAGNLQKCWEDMGNEDHGFGKIGEWDPSEPFATACKLDNLTKYLNTLQPGDDAECRECIWLPACKGQCPHKRLFSKKNCIEYKDHPDEYVRALLERMKEEGRHEKTNANGSI